MIVRASHGTRSEEIVGGRHYRLGMTVKLSVESVNFESADPRKLASFWAEATGGSVTGGDDTLVIVSPPPSGGITMFFRHVPDIRPERTGIHLDLSAPKGEREAEVERLTKLGATKKYDIIGEVPWVDWTTMSDPEGNLFCVGAPPH
jgi:hypothetical protein